MPFIVDLKSKKTIADSSFIIEYLLKNYDCKLIQHHTDSPELYAFQKMIEESLYFSILYNRWVDPQNTKIVVDKFKDLFPPFIGKPFLNLIRMNLIKQSKAQGIGRHSKKEVYQLAVNELKAIDSFWVQINTFQEIKLAALTPLFIVFLH